MQLLDYTLIVAGYLFGSISSAILVCRVMSLPDPRTQGSNNPGATNVLRFGGKKAAAIVLVGDMVKGVIPVLVAQGLGVGTLTIAMVGFTAFLGHLYPVFFNFKGGKGVATAFGVYLAFNWLSGVLVLLAWLVVAKVFKISSVAGLIASALAPVIFWFVTADINYVAFSIAMAIILTWRHRSNIQNLLAGTEDSIGSDVDDPRR